MNIVANKQSNLKWHDYVGILLVPIGLVVTGGLLGGLVGGIFMTINQKIFKSDRTRFRKHMLVLLMDVLAFICFVILGFVWLAVCVHFGWVKPHNIHTYTFVPNAHRY